MKQYSSVEEYVKDIYDNLYPRAKAAVNIIMSKGYMTKYDLRSQNISPDQGPRAIADLKEHGIPIVKMGRMKVKESKNPIVRYTFGRGIDIIPEWSKGRNQANKDFKQLLLRTYGNRCPFCGKTFELEKLQIDHRLPVKYFGDLRGREKFNPDNYLLICPNCNRRKAEAIDNGCAKTCYKTNNMNVIKSCYWYDPLNYAHVCMKQERIETLKWVGDDTEIYDQAKELLKEQGMDMKKYLREQINNQLMRLLQQKHH